MTDLLPCPLCQKLPKVSTGWIICSTKWCAWSSVMAKTTEAATKKWNAKILKLQEPEKPKVRRKPKVIQLTLKEAERLVKWCDAQQNHGAGNEIDDILDGIKEDLGSK